jgi:hypothetical protein
MHMKILERSSWAVEGLDPSGPVFFIAFRPGSAIGGRSEFVMGNGARPRAQAGFSVYGSEKNT